MDGIKMSFWDEKEAKRMFQKLPFYITFIGIPCIKLLKNMDLHGIKYKASIKSI